MSLDGTKTDGTRIDGGGFPGLGEPPVVTVLTVDGIEYSICADPTMASLKAIREIAEHVRPRRGCQEGICGKCESIVNGVETRLCITPIGTLGGAVVVTPEPRKSIWG
ncbi:MAG TPA: 2Fe-2S iron-sulfur cluster-binding protein [Ilumatobacteraceae bacterium]|nr:2Fe-2S iron-sulfur cluster-binding protein [Ilumatobacteraceae bacterium]